MCLYKDDDSFLFWVFFFLDHRRFIGHRRN